MGIVSTLYYSYLGEEMNILRTHCKMSQLAGYSNGATCFFCLFFFNVLENWLNVKDLYRYDNGNSQLNLNSMSYNNDELNYRNKNLHMKDWIAAGVYGIIHILHETKNCYI